MSRAGDLAEEVQQARVDMNAVCWSIAELVAADEPVSEWWRTRYAIRRLRWDRAVEALAADAEGSVA